MLDHMVQLRNQAVFARLSQASDEQDDPMTAQGQEGRPCMHVPKRRRLEMIDDWNDRWITIIPIVGGVPIQANVLAAACRRAQLTIEWTEQVVGLLLKTPDIEFKDKFPTMHNDPGAGRCCQRTRGAVWLRTS